MEKEKEETQNVGESNFRIFNKKVDFNVQGKKDGGCSGKDCFHDNYIHLHKHTSGGIFGLLVIFAGILLLLNNLGMVPVEAWTYVWPFWPIFLILVGIRLISGFSKTVSFLIFFLAFVLFAGVFFYALARAGSPLISGLHLSQGFFDFINNLK
jgi:hypothetical protein